jgi:hypothetical protein
MVGQIYTWSLLGWGFVVVNGKDLYFLHSSEIKEGMDKITIKQWVKFDAAPAMPGKKYPRATNAVVGGGQ